MYIFTYTNTGTGIRTDKNMEGNSLFITMRGLRDKLLFEYGDDRVFLWEVENTDTIISIRYSIGGFSTYYVGSVWFNSDKNKWELDDFDFDEFKRLVGMKITNLVNQKVGNVN